MLPECPKFLTESKSSQKNPETRKMKLTDKSKSSGNRDKNKRFAETENSPVGCRNSKDSESREGLCERDWGWIRKLWWLWNAASKLYWLNRKWMCSRAKWSMWKRKRVSIYLLFKRKRRSAHAQRFSKAWKTGWSKFNFLGLHNCRLVDLFAWTHEHCADIMTHRTWRILFLPHRLCCDQVVRNIIVLPLLEWFLTPC